jgi:tRNA A-37 threonylcarbamoyl transferase component Bud32
VAIPTEIGRYKVVGELGRGAMGVVYRGVDPALDRHVAIKVISSQQSAGALNTQEMEARFLREAKIAARINHPGIVTVYDAGRAGDSLYLVMELIEGESLAHRIARKEYPTVPESFMMVAQCAEALAAAHALGVVHRDVKPANIMLTKDGRVKVADFGVAKAIGEGTDLTRTGTVVGSPAYMAPEQVRGLSPDGRADLFSLGVVLYELLLHRKPFPADTITSLIYQILHEDPLVDTDAARGLGDRTSNFLRFCLAKEPKDRVPDGNAFAAEARALAAQAASSAAEMTSATKLIATPPPPKAAPSGPAPQPAPVATGAATIAVQAKKFPLVPVLGGAVGLLAIVIVALLLRSRSAPAPATTVAVAPPTAVPTAVAVAPSEPAAGPQVEPTEAPQQDAYPLHVNGQSRVGSAPTAVPEPRTTRLRPIQQVAPPPPVVRQVYVPPTAVPTPQPTPTPMITQVFECREGANFNVSPQKAEVIINGRLIGIADDWDGAFFGKMGKTYMFPGPGIYYAKFTYPERRTTWVKIIVTPEARKRIADVDTRMPKLDR